MKQMPLLFLVMLFTATQAIAELDKDLVVYFTFDKVKGKKILDASGNDLDAEIVANDADLRIGCAKNHPQYTFKNGSIDEVGLWRRALTQSEIRQVMGGALAVSPKDKVATTWGDIKRSVWKN